MKQLVNGVEMPKLIRFTIRKPGEETTKTVCIKNVGQKPLKFTHNIPGTPYFSSEFPVNHVLSTGMSANISLTFKASTHQHYLDEIEFQTSVGDFRIPIVANMPRHLLKFPKRVSFNYCVVGKLYRRRFRLKNSGELCSEFRWDSAGPFSFEPSTGVLEPEESTFITVSYQAKVACSVEAVAVCYYGENVAQPLAIDAVSKYAHLALSHEVVDFEQLTLNQRRAKSITLHNPSAVEASFNVLRREHSAFTVKPERGCVKPGETLELDVVFHPSRVAIFNETVELRLAHTVRRFVCTGKSIAPNVEISASRLDFGDVQVGSTTTKTFTISNRSSCPTFYQFELADEGYLSSEKKAGFLEAFASAMISIKFSPRSPMVFYKKLHCLIENHDTLVIDVIATSWNDDSRPPTFHGKFLDLHLNHLQNGLYLYPPEQLDNMARMGLVRPVEGGLEMTEAMEVDNDYKPPPKLYSGHEDYYVYTRPREDIILSTLMVDFGSSSVNPAQIARQIISVTNNAKGPVTFVWHQIFAKNMPFKIEPAEAVVEAGGTRDFRVLFNPQNADTSFDILLDGSCFFTSMRNFRFINHHNFAVPWSFAVRLCGHTCGYLVYGSFGGGNTGNIRIDPERPIEMGDVEVGRPAWRTIRVSGDSEGRLRYRIVSKDADTVAQRNSVSVISPPETEGLEILPSVGVVEPMGSKLLLIRFNPQNSSSYSFSRNFSVNEHLDDRQFEVCGNGFSKLSVNESPSGRYITFRPTCALQRSHKTFAIRNPTGEKINFECKFKEFASGDISVEPSSGQLGPFESKQFKLNFSPKKAKLYSMNMAFFSWSDNRGGREKTEKRIVFHIAGQCIPGRINSDTEKIGFDNVLVHSAATSSFLVCNPTDCDVEYEIKALVRCGPNQLKFPSHEASEVSVKPQRAMLSAKSHRLTQVKVVPLFADQINVALYAVLPSTYREPSGKVFSAKSFPGFYLCDVTAKGVLPCLQVVDVRASGISKGDLWDNFSLNYLNRVLKNVKTKSSQPNLNEDAHPELKLLSCPQFDLGCGAVGSAEAVVTISLRNIGVVPAQWSLAFPSQEEIEQDFPNLNEIGIDSYSSVIESRIFSAIPKRGSLNPGEFVNIALTYRHASVGTHKFPLVMTSKSGLGAVGKPIVIIVTGTSFSNDSRILHISHTKKELRPVPLGLHEFPVQTLTISNPTQQAIEFSIDDSAIDQLTQSMPIAKITSPTAGTLGPNSKLSIDVVFCPLQPRIYEMPLSITCDSNTSYQLNLVGEGIPGKKLDEYPMSVPVPAQIFASPQALVRLSQDALNFGSFPSGVELQNVVTVTNNHSEHPISFSWLLDDCEMIRNCVQIAPASGQVEPGKSAVCKFIFIPDYQPRVYNFSVECLVRDEKDYSAYRAKMAAINRRREAKPSDGRKMSIRPSEKSSPRILGGLLPPINLVGAPSLLKFQSVANDLARSIGDTSSRGQRGDPEAPPTQSFFVSITGTSFSPDDYKNLYADSNRFHYKKASTAKKAAEHELENLKPGQKRLIRSTLNTVLDQVLTDDDLLKIMDAHQRPDVSYYFTMSDRAVSASDRRRRNERKEEKGDYKTENSSEKLVGSKNFESMIHNILDNAALDALQEVTVGLEPQDRGSSFQRGSVSFQSTNSVKRGSNARMASTEGTNSSKMRRS